MTALADAHIAAQQRLRAVAARSAASIWNDLPGYDETDVEPFLRRAVPLVIATQRQSAALTEAFLARATGRRPLGINPAAVIGANARNGTAPETVYRRPFVTVWTALGAGRGWEAAVAEGLHRLTSTAQTDVQLAMRQTLREVGQADDLIVGYQRVPDPGACTFCMLVSGQRYTTEDLMPIHNHCGCGVDVITTGNRHEFTGNTKNDLAKDAPPVDVRDHGELGPVLVGGDHHFTSEGDL